MPAQTSGPMSLVEICVTFGYQQNRGSDPLPAAKLPSFGFHPGLPDNWCVVPALEGDAVVRKHPPCLLKPLPSVLGNSNERSVCQNTNWNDHAAVSRHNIGTVPSGRKGISLS